MCRAISHFCSVKVRHHRSPDYPLPLLPLPPLVIIMTHWQGHYPQCHVIIFFIRLLVLDQRAQTAVILLSAALDYNAYFRYDVAFPPPK